MRFKQNHCFPANLITTTLISILIIVLSFVATTHQIQNVSQNESMVSASNHNHITASDRPQHYYFCGEPPTVANANSNLMRNQKHNVFKVGEIAVYSCDIGFRKIEGREETQCTPGEGSAGPRWQPIDLKCEVVRCEDPGPIDNGFLKQKDEFKYNTIVQYECKTEFRMIGVPFLMCKGDAKWNRPKPKCQRKQCPELDSLPNGRITYTDPERRTDSKLEYTCNLGFKLNVDHSVAIRLCRQDDTWSEAVGVNHSTIACELVKCEAPIRPHSGLRILPSRSKSSSNSYKPGDVIIYTCDTSPKVKASSKCMPDGIWSRGPPHCPERPTICPSVAEFANGWFNVTKSSPADKLLTPNSKLNFFCNEHYMLDGPQSLTCLSSGVWNGSVPRCLVNTSPRTKSESSKLTILITSIAVLVVIVFVVSCVVVCRWRQQQLQRRRWQQYFGHYNHRQSKTNIMLNQNEMKCFRQTPPKSTVPVTDL